MTESSPKIVAMTSPNKVRSLDNSRPSAAPISRPVSLISAPRALQALSFPYFEFKSMISNLLAQYPQLKPNVFNILDHRKGGGGASVTARRSRLASAFAVLATLLIVATSPISAHAQAQANGVEATSIPLFEPAGIAYDAAGNMYIAELNENLIRKVDTHGIITTLAGTGEQGYGGDNGPATSAILDSPAGIALDSSGNVYFSDSHNNRIREINTTTGVITTIAGTGVAGFSGDGSAATSATLNLPLGVAVDSSGNVYIADTNNHRIRKITGTTISTIAGNGDQGYEGDNVLATATGLDSPNSLALDASLNVYISDTHNQRIRLVTVATGIITTYAGNGTRAYSGDSGAATSASLNRPRGISIDANGNVYIVDSDNNRLRTVTNGTINTLAGTGEQGFSGDAGVATSAVLDTPRATGTFSSGGVTSAAVSDANNQRVRAVNSSTGIINTVAGVGAPALALTLTGTGTEVYGTGSLVATFYNAGKNATGTVTLLEGANTLGTGTLSSDTTTLTIPTLSVGTHSLVATYPGDANNPAVASGLFVLTVTPLPITATANAVSVLYGQAIPTLTGTLTGVLSQDTANVTAVWSTTATQGSAVGVYPITVALTGSAAANYTVTLSSTSGSVTISAAGSKTVLASSNNPANLGTPVTLTATVTSTTTGTPSGPIVILDGTTQIASGTLNASGAFSFTTSTLALGTHSLTAVYAPTTDFTGSTSTALSEVITVDPDFTVGPSVITASLTTTPGSAAAFQLVLAPNPAPFTNPITFSVSGLPAGATATFSPSTVTLNGSPAYVTMTVQTAALAMLHRTEAIGGTIAFSLLLWPLFARRRKIAGRFSRLALTLLVLLGSAAATSLLSGCGARNGFFGQAPQTYTLTVTATSTSVTSAPLQHTTTVQLTVE